MAQTNTRTPKAPVVTTHEGGRAKQGTPMQTLTRTVNTCLLWEDNFYEDGQSVADRIQALVPECPAAEVAALAVAARQQYGLRHVPLLVVRAMLRATPAHLKLVEETLYAVCQRADEMTEFLSIYWESNNGKKTVPWPVKRALAKRIAELDEYKLSKWDSRGKKVRMRDVLFLSHAKPRDVTDPRKWDRAARKQARDSVSSGDGVVQRPWAVTDGEALFAKVTLDQLQQYDTWEDELSSGADKKETFVKLMADKKLGALAFIRNLRGMNEAGVDSGVIREYAKVLVQEPQKLNGIFPYQYVTAARNAGPKFEPMIDSLMLGSLSGMGKVLKGKTIVMVDISGSMDAPLSQNRGNRIQAQVQMTTRIDAAASLAILCTEICEEVELFTFSDKEKAVPVRKGMALVDAINKSQPHSGTQMFESIRAVIAKTKYDRIIVISDEQAASDFSFSGKIPDPRGKGYILNVAPYEHGVSHGKWVTISGWSPHVVRYIAALEA